MAIPQSKVDLCYTDAVDLSRMIHGQEISSQDLVAAFLAQIERINPQVNAIPTLLPEKAMREAELADRALARGDPIGPLHGLPHAVKDLVETEGIRTTKGSPIFRDFVPDRDALLVERLKAAGAIIMGKTNVPEFGAGSQTFNPVFGATRNPYDLARTAGGSSGGAAAALACGMVPLADGSDLGGSLRNPASFCNVVGFRPSPGRVPRWPAELAWFSLPVLGPMGRTVRDVAFLLSVLAGPDRRAPLSLQEPGELFLKPLERDFAGTRIAWTPDLGRYPVEPAVRETCEAALAQFAHLGCIVEEDAPDLDGVDEIFQTLRAWSFAHSLGGELATKRDLLKGTVIWNIERGMALSGLDLAKVEAKRTALYHRVEAFMGDYDYLILPVTQVAPFSVETEWVREINGVAMETYIDWMATCYAITVTELPAISVPCGFSPDGLPVGLQIVGRRRADYSVLQLAHAFEVLTQNARVRPPLVEDVLL